MRSKRRRYQTDVTLGLLLGLILWWFAGTFERATDAGENAGGAREIGVGWPATVALGTADDGAVRPGATLPLDLTFDNPYDAAVRIEAATVTVTDVDAPRASDDLPCTPDDFVVRGLLPGAAVVIGPDAEATLGELGVDQHYWPAVGMRNRPVNQDGCKGAVLHLAYEASGREVQR